MRLLAVLLRRFCLPYALPDTYYCARSDKFPFLIVTFAWVSLGSLLRDLSDFLVEKYRGCLATILEQERI